LGLDAESDTTVLKMYEGMFERIKRMHPLDYYWIWTPESWTWQDISEKEIQKTEKDLVIATKAARNIDAPFTLATCGWVLGPPEDADRFDQILPEEMPFSCINRYLGFEFVDPTFEKLQNRPKWAIPWLEDDPAMVSPQLWAGRMRTDAVDALEYGCNGLMGIHWRTRAIGPTVSSLAKAAWRQNKWKTELPDTVRDMPIRDFYVDWAGANFGQNVAESLGNFFTQLDGGPYCPFRSGMVANLYRTSKWNQGPGAILVNSKPWNEIKTEFTFVDELKKYQAEIQGKGNQKRFDYWLKTFQYTKTMAELGCILGAIDSTIQRVNTMPNIVEKKSMIQNKAIGLRIKATQKWQDMVTLLLATVSTPGEMGTVANLEQHSKNHLQLLTRHDSLMTAILGRPLPDSVKPDKKYHGSFRIIVPTKRTLLQENEHLILKVIVLSREPVKTVKMNWRPLGSRSFQTIRAKHLARGVYTIKLNSETIGNQDFEYYIDVKTKETDGLFPVTAPDINQTVVVM
jgi:hypothetical protein